MEKGSRRVSYGWYIRFSHLQTWAGWLIRSDRFMSCRHHSSMTEQPRPSSPSPRASFMKSNPDKDKDSGREKESDSGLRQRGVARAATFAADDSSNLSSFRRNSALSDSVSEARNSIRSSTDDLFLPRVSKGHDVDLQEESHWQSLPLGLALLPAIAGIFFQNGGAVVTDITLLVLAAIFLNWSVRLPWYVIFFQLLNKLFKA